MTLATWLLALSLLIGLPNPRGAPMPAAPSDDDDDGAPILVVQLYNE